jgi:hypothetical protein
MTGQDYLHSLANSKGLVLDSVIESRVPSDKFHAFSVTCMTEASVKIHGFNCLLVVKEWDRNVPDLSVICNHKRVWYIHFHTIDELLESFDMADIYIQLLREVVR